MTDYIKRQDAVRAMAQYLMDIALIDNPEASDRIEQWEGSIAAPVMSTVKAADVRENVKGEWIKKLSTTKMMNRSITTTTFTALLAEGSQKKRGI